MPPIQYKSIFEDPVHNLSQLIWPAVATGYRYSAVATRMIRSALLEVLREDYVRAACAKGMAESVIINLHHPAVHSAVCAGGALQRAVLSGARLQEPVPAWGLMLQGGASEYAESAPWVPIFPGLAITVAVFGFNLFGDALRDMLDPRMRKQ